MARYTADEMREAANAVNEVSINDNGEYFYEKDEKFNPFLVRDMLRHAADAMEREKKYEYAIGMNDGTIFHRSRDLAEVRNEVECYNEGGKTICKLVRRSVGEWEDVPNEE